MMYKAMIPVFAAMLLVACSSEVKDEDISGTTQPGDTTQQQQQGTTDGSKDAASLLTDPNSPLSKRSVYFDFDSYAIKPGYRSLVEAHAKFLANNSQHKVLIQGNADERGSREYNLALGQRRANAVKRAMKLLGANENQLEAVSLGEEKPVCAQRSESCYAQNRRADIRHSAAREF